MSQPRASRVQDRYHTFTGDEIRETDGTVFVNHNGSYQFARPDFNLQQLHSTVLLAWEYRPGSSVFAIWTHGRTNQLTDGRFDLGDNLGDLARAAGENIVMIKANYWIGL